MVNNTDKGALKKVEVEFTKVSNKGWIKNDSLRHRAVIFFKEDSQGVEIDKYKELEFGKEKDKWVITQSLIK